MAQQTIVQEDKLNLLRRSLLVDGLTSGITGIILTAGAKPVGLLLGLDTPFSVGIGIVTLLYAAMLLQAALRTPLNLQIARAAVILNLAWVLGSAFILLTGWLSLTTAGTWIIAVVADVVAVFALVQFYALRQISRR